MKQAPRVPPGWTVETFPWPEWERTCPGCGRYHRYWHFDGGELDGCAYCGWKGELSSTEGTEPCAL